MKSAKPIFLYTPLAGMTDAIIKKVERAGYLPLAVESFDAIKVVDLMPLASLEPISRAAFDVIAAATPFEDGIVKSFGRRVAKALGTKTEVAAK